MNDDTNDETRADEREHDDAAVETASDLDASWAAWPERGPL